MSRENQIEKIMECVRGKFSVDSSAYRTVANALAEKLDDHEIGQLWTMVLTVSKAGAEDFCPTSPDGKHDFIFIAEVGGGLKQYACPYCRKRFSRR